MMEKKYLKASDVAVLADVSPKTAYRLMHDIGAIKMRGGLRVEKKDFDRYMNDRKLKPQDKFVARVRPYRKRTGTEGGA